MEATRSSVLSFLLLCSALPGILSMKVISLQSITIFTTHDWLPLEPTIFFRCQGDNMTILPDVKETNLLYTFKGVESWQPLTELPDKKCKRCGLYERDTMKSDDAFDEWELCPDDFHNGTYARFKEKEFNATFRAIMNESSETVGGSGPVGNVKEEVGSGTTRRHLSIAIVITISALVSIVAVVGAVSGYKYWQKRKREKDQARFLKIFEEADDIEDELGLGTII